MRSIAFLYTLSLVFMGILYNFLHVEISTCKVDSTAIELPFVHAFKARESYNYSCTIESKLDKERIIAIQVDDTIEQITLNDKDIDLSYHTQKYAQDDLSNYATGYQFKLPLIVGENHLHVRGLNKKGSYSFNVQSGLSLDEYLLIFVLVIAPLMLASFKLFFLLLDTKILRLPSKKMLYLLPFFIILIGILLRINLLINTNNGMYQHDVHGHKEMIVYYAHNGLDFPQADKSLQAPQQALYYLLSAQVYKLSIALGYKEHEAFYAVRSLSIVYAIGVLLIGYFFIQLFSRKRLYVNLFLAFLALTPYFVFMGAQINNDALNTLLGMAVLYYIVKYYKHPSAKSFILLMLLIPLALLTKISSLLFALSLLVVLFLHYFYYSKDSTHFFKKSLIQKRIMILSFVTIFIFSLALLKAYIPTLGEFRFVNSGLFSNQIIPALDFEYFFSFHFIDLISEGQSHVFGEDSIRHSFFTFEYGSMLLGEYGYDKYFLGGSLFKLLSQVIFLLGLIYVIGLIAYLLTYKKQSPLAKFLLLPVMINMFLIIKFLSDYWNICNSDFRYYSPVIGAIGLIFVLGIKEVLEAKPYLKKGFIGVAILFYSLQIVWSVYIVHITH